MQELIEPLTTVHVDSLFLPQSNQFLQGAFYKYYKNNVIKDFLVCPGADGLVLMLEMELSSFLSAYISASLQVCYADIGLVDFIVAELPQWYVLSSRVCVCVPVCLSLSP